MSLRVAFAAFATMTIRVTRHILANLATLVEEHEKAGWTVKHSAKVVVDMLIEDLSQVGDDGMAMRKLKTYYEVCVKDLSDGVSFGRAELATYINTYILLIRAEYAPKTRKPRKNMNVRFGAELAVPFDVDDAPKHVRFMGIKCQPCRFEDSSTDMSVLKQRRMEREASDGQFIDDLKIQLLARVNEFQSALWNAQMTQNDVDKIRLLIDSISYSLRSPKVSAEVYIQLLRMCDTVKDSMRVSQLQQLHQFLETIPEEPEVFDAVPMPRASPVAQRVRSYGYPEQFNAVPMPMASPVARRVRY